MTAGRHAVRVTSRVLVSASLLLACTSSNTLGFERAESLPEYYLGEGYRAWLADGSLFVEVRQTPGLNVATIECVLFGQDLLLSPRRISSGGSSETTFEIVLPGSRAADLWADHIFWVTRETFVPVWAGAPTRPSERVPLLLQPVPPEEPKVRRPARHCS